jgi:hypothetical protein
MAVDHKHLKIALGRLHLFVITNMATMRNFEVMPNQLNIAEYLLLGCSTVWFRFLPTFRRNVSPPSSGQVVSTGSQFNTYCRLVVRVRKY